MSKLSFKSVLLYQNQNTHFTIFIQGDVNKFTLYRYCYSKLFQKVSCKLLVLTVFTTRGCTQLWVTRHVPPKTPYFFFTHFHRKTPIFTNFHPLTPYF